MSTPILAASAFICGFVADQRGLDETLVRGFDRAPQRHIGERPHHRGGDGRQALAALQKLVEDVVVGGWPTSGSTVTASARGARSLIFPALSRPERESNPFGLSISFLPGRGK